MFDTLIHDLASSLFYKQYLKTDIADLESAYTRTASVETFLPERGTGVPASLFGPFAPAYPKKVKKEALGVFTSARSIIVEDGVTEMMMIGRRPDDVRSIGSVTKLMTAIVFLEAKPELTKEVTLTPDDYVGGGRLYLNYFDETELADVFTTAIVGSDNTATESLVRFSGMEKEAFVAKMNEKARELGMTSTTFVDPTGIRSENTSTARDMIKLLRTAETYDVLQEAMTTATATIVQGSGAVITVDNTNQLLASYLAEPPFAITAGKTGYLPQAGYVLTSAVEKDGHKVYVAVLGAETKTDRETDVKALAEWVFDVFSWE